MPISSSRYFNDPALASAASNLAGLFAPPSGSDAAGWAAANAKRAEAARLAELFNYTKDPNFDQTQFDRLGIGAGVYAPSQSYYSVDQGNLTTQRGQDVIARTSTGNNAADNARALEIARLTNQNDIAKTLLAPVGADATRFIPKSIADLYDTGSTQVGVAANAADNARALEVARMEDAAARRDQDIDARTSTRNNAADNARALEVGQIGTLADLFKPVAQDAMRPEIPEALTSRLGVDGTLPEVQGNRSPLSETQVKAAVFGGLTPEMQQAITFGSTPIDPIVTPTGPKNVLRPDAIGETPYEKPAGAGMTVTLPDGTVVATGGKSTEAENKAAFAGTMAEGASNDLVAAFDTPGQMPTGADFQFFNLMRNTPLATHPALVSQMSPQGQKFYQNIRTALPYQLMAKSGLAVTEQEYERALMELVPVPGEDPGVTAGKRRQFAQFVGTIHGLSGSAWAKAHANPATPPPAPADAAAPAEIVAPVTAPSPTSAAPPQAAIDFLKANPDAAADFDAKYGPGAAARATGGQ